MTHPCTVQAEIGRLAFVAFLYKVMHALCCILMLGNWMRGASKIPRLGLFAWSLFWAALPLFELALVFCTLSACIGMYLHVSTTDAVWSNIGSTAVGMFSEFFYGAPLIIVIL